MSQCRFTVPLIAFLALTSSLTFKVAIAQEATSGEPPVKLFIGSSLNGWKSVGSGDWKVDQGSIVAPASAAGKGWLTHNEGYQDFVMELSFECGTDCRSGILVRASKQGSGLSGIYIPIGGPDMGRMYRATVGSDNTIGKMTPMPATSPTPLTPIGEGPCDPYPCAGIRDARGGGLSANAVTGNAPPAPQFNLSSTGWNTAIVTMRGDVISASINGTPLTAARMDNAPLFGQIAIQAGNAKFNDIHLWDLNTRTAGLAKPYTSPDFRKIVLNDSFYSEGISAGDINHDGNVDIVAGPFWFEGPDFKVAHEIYPPQTQSTMGPEGGYPDEHTPTIPLMGTLPDKSGPAMAQSTAIVHGNYSTNFMSFTYDFNGDGYPDVLVIMGFGARPTFTAHLFINPKGEHRLWDNYTVSPVIADEIDQFVDIDKDGKPELIMRTATKPNWSDAQVGILRPDWSDVTKPWKFTPISEPGVWYGHGSGVGDINGDGRLDIVNGEGWWEQPASGGGLWKYHKQRFGVDAVRCGPGCGGSEISVYDVNGDGLPDVITSLAAHGPGLAWYEQQRNGDNITWKRHLIMGDPTTPKSQRSSWEETDKSVDFIELHALAFADMNGDGLQDIVTGKRWWSHGFRYEENDVNDPPVLYWFELHREGHNVTWIPHMIDNASGVGTQLVAVDVNKDGKPDVLSAQRKGIMVFLNNVPKKK
jgi:hypothetical protein